MDIGQLSKIFDLRKTRIARMSSVEGTVACLTDGYVQSMAPCLYGVSVESAVRAKTG